jgi:hypothetical protein
MSRHRGGVRRHANPQSQKVTEPIQLSFRPSYLEQLVLGSGPGAIVIDSAFDRDSVSPSISACHGDDFNLTISSVL